MSAGKGECDRILGDPHVELQHPVSHLSLYL